MFLLLHFFQFFSSPPLFVFPYHFKVNPFSNVIFFCWTVLHLYTSNKGIIFISSLCPLWSHFQALELSLEKKKAEYVIEMILLLLTVILVGISLFWKLSF